MIRYKDIDLYTKILEDEIHDIKNFENSMYQKGKRHGLMLAKAIVLNDERIPTADVAPVRHGHWIKYAKYSFGTMYDCSICGTRILDDDKHSWHYCPNCGAKMNEEKEDKE